tara:strand:+ start:3303 stop:4517 length:1215 start_codon:yes stop_codon:yes gene_type:complete
MTTRKIDSGKEGDVPDDFFIPESGIEDTDRAIFDLFDKRLGFQIKVKDQARKVPVVFSTGERFALTRRRQPIRDRNNALILPVIAIHRTSIDNTANQGGYGTAISFRDQQSYVVRKRLSEKDRNYQNIINKLRLKNQKNVSSRANFDANDTFPGNVAEPGKTASRRNLNNLSYRDDINGDLLRDQVQNNIFEIITVPYPVFMCITYEVIFWTQYMQQMNQIIETMMSQFDGQDDAFSIKSRTGHEYVAYVKGPINNQDNFSDFSSDERVIKYSFEIKVPTYLLAPDMPGQSSPFRRFYSAPQIEFGYVQSSTQVIAKNGNPEGVIDQNRFILSDVENIDKYGEVDGMKGQQGSERLLDVMEDPFTGEKNSRYVRVLTRDQRSGETVASSRITVDLQTTLDTIPD